VKVKTKISSQFRNKESRGLTGLPGFAPFIDTSLKNGQEVYPALLSLAKL
jgi:hypothetical protein